jgi:Holliday junction resolvase RusA-like endonuclease
MWQLKKYRKSFGDEIISADFIFSMKGKMDTDIDNMISGVLDILQDAEVFPDDKRITEIHAVKAPGCKNWGVQVVLTAK